MSDDHIAVKIDGVIYVKLDDVKPMRARIEKLEATLREIVDRAEHRMGHAVSDDVCAISRKALEGKDG